MVAKALFVGALVVFAFLAAPTATADGHGPPEDDDDFCVAQDYNGVPHVYPENCYLRDGKL